MAPLLKLLNTTSELAEPFQIKQRWLLKWKCIWCRRVRRPTGGNGPMIAIDVSNDQVGIWTTTNTDDFDLLTRQGMMGMRDGHPSRNSGG